MVTEVASKQQLESLASELRSKSTQLGSDVSSIMTMLNGVSDYDGINITQAANTISNNLQTIMSSLDGVIAGISSYAQSISTTDVYGLDSSQSTNSNINSIPNNSGSYVNTNTGSNTTTSPTGSTGSTGSTGNVGSTGSSGGTRPSGSTGSTGNSGSSGGNTNSGGGIVPVVPVNPSNGNDGGGSQTQNPGSSNEGSSEQLTSGQRAEKVVISSGDPNYQMSGKYMNNSELGFNVTTGNFAYELSDKDVDLLCAIVSSESDLSYDDSMAVISTILNRCDNSDFIAKFGKDPIAQITGLNQITSYGNGIYKEFLGGKAPAEVVSAVKDALSGVRNHKFLNYQANSFTDFSNNMITSSGNRYK